MSEFIVGARGHDFGRHSVEELLTSIGDAGFRCTQLAYTKAVEGVKSYADVTPELVAATNAAVQKSGVSIAVDGTYVELSYADEDKRRAEVAKALSQVPVAKALRAGCMGSETTNMAKQPTVSRREAQEALLRSLGEILPVCEEQGVLFRSLRFSAADGGLLCMLVVSLPMQPARRAFATGTWLRAFATSARRLS